MTSVFWRLFEGTLKKFILVGFSILYRAATGYAGKITTKRRIFIALHLEKPWT
jgi:hypothetical protein